MGGSEWQGVPSQILLTVGARGPGLPADSGPHGRCSVEDRHGNRSRVFRKTCPGKAEGRWLGMQCVGPEGKGEGGLKNGWPREGPHGTAGWGDWVRLGGCSPPPPAGILKSLGMLAR